MASQTPPFPKRQVVRLKDIAEKSNVSLTTVSRLLRGQNLKSFPQETRDRVYRVAQECGWSPNRLVQGIQTGRTGSVGLVMAPFGEHWQAVMVSLHRTLLQADSVPITLYPDYDARATDGGVGTELGYLRHLMERRVDGFVCWPLRDKVAIDYLYNVCAPQVPVVTIEFELPVPRSSIVVQTQEYMAMKQAVDHLLELGHRRIGFYSHEGSHNWAVHRQKAFADIMRKRDLTPAFVLKVRKGAPDTAVQFQQVLPQATAVIAGSEQLAISAWHIAGELGLQAPRDLSIVSFGRPRFEFVTCPRFTHIDQRPEQIGEVAGSMIVDPERRQSLKSPHIKIEPVLIAGETTGEPKANPSAQP